MSRTGQQRLDAIPAAIAAALGGRPMIEAADIKEILEEEVYFNSLYGEYDYGAAVPRILALIVNKIVPRAERLRLALEQIGWMDEFLDADGARAMMQIARAAVNADEAVLNGLRTTPPERSHEG